MDLHQSGGQFTVKVRRSWPANLLFEVDSFSELLMRETQEYKSMAFVVGNYKWRLIICPENETDNISLFLSVDGIDELPDGWGVKASCSILLFNQISNNFICFEGKAEWFDAENSKWGFSISKRILTQPGYLVDDSCLFGAEVLINQIPAIEYFQLKDWEISNVSRLNGHWISPKFGAGGLRWKMMFYPNGNFCTPGTNNVSIFLECVDSKNFASNEKAEAEICIRMKNKWPTAHIFKKTSHCFTSNERVWGFPDFIPITEFRSRSTGFIFKDCCFIEVEILVKKVCY